MARYNFQESEAKWQSAWAAAKAFAGEPSPHIPASLVRARDGRTVAILDRAAAAKLSA